MSIWLPDRNKRKPLSSSKKDRIARGQYYRCKRCGKPFGPDTHWDIDHIDNDPTNNDDDNLQALCLDCHRGKHENDEPKDQNKKQGTGSIEW